MIKKSIGLFCIIFPKQIAPAYERLFYAALNLIRAHVKFIADGFEAIFRLVTGRKKEEAPPPECEFVNGDTLLSIGTSWVLPGYLDGVAHAKQRFGIIYVSMIYDLIPWLVPGLTWGLKPIRNKFDMGAEFNSRPCQIYCGWV